MRFGFEPVSSRHASVRVNARGYVSECVCETEKERGILYPVSCGLLQTSQWEQ